MRYIKHNGSNETIAKDINFLTKIKSKYTPNVKNLNEKVEELFKEINKTAEGNIRYIFGIITSEEFRDLVDELGPISIFGGELFPLQAHNKAAELKVLTEKYKKLPITKYYWKCLSLYYMGWKEVKAGYGYIEIDGCRYSTVSELYESKYRLFFVDYDDVQFRESLKNYLRNIGAIND